MKNSKNSSSEQDSRESQSFRESFHQLSLDVNCVIHEDEKENNSSSNMVSMTNNSKVKQSQSFSNKNGSYGSKRGSIGSKDKVPVEKCQKQMDSLKSEDISECSQEDSSGQPDQDQIVNMKSVINRQSKDSEKNSSELPEKDMKASMVPGIIKRQQIQEKEPPSPMTNKACNLHHIGVKNSELLWHS